MTHALHIGLTADTLPGPVRINLDGCLTEVSIQELLPTLRRGASFQGCPEVLVDLSRVHHVDAAALGALQDFTTGHNALGAVPRMSILLPATGSAAPPSLRCDADVPS